MANYQSQYKVNNNFGNIKNNRAKRARISELKRKEQRIEDFAKKRELEIIPDEKTEDVKDNRYHKLLKWRAERDRLKKMEQIKKKPAFKVGVVHHNYYSPPIKDSSVLPPIKSSLHNQKQITQPTLVSRRITRATEKRLLRKQEILTTEVPPKQNVKEKKQKKSEGKNKRKNNVKTEQKSFAPSNYKFTAPSGITSMPLFGRVNIILTPVKDSKSINNKIEDRISSLNEKSESLDQDYNETTNINDKMPNNSIISGSIETLNNNREMTFNFSDKEGEFLRNSTFSDDSSHSKMTLSPSNISAIMTEKETHKNSSNNKIKTSFSKKISKGKVINKSFQNINSSQSKKTPSSTNDNANLTETNLFKDPAYFSPYIVSKRGKSNARKEQQLRRGIGSPNDNIPTKETVMQTLNLSIEEEERTAQYFAFLLKKETDKLNELINKWTDIQKESNITEDAQYLINQAIGQTRLLINKKFERFQRLVSDCESGKGEMLVTCRDLQGFWDMMYMEIQNCDSRFEALEKLRSRGWEEEKEEIVVKVKPKRKVVSKKKVVPKKKSSVQAFILAAKQKMKNNTNNSKILEKDANESLTSVNNIDIENRDDILINGDIKHLKSTDSKDELSVVATNENTRQSLLKKTLLLETCKSIQTPMTIMKISQMYKTPKIELDDSISYINSKQTPSKSILKRSDDFPINNIHLSRSTQKVNFNDQVVLNELSDSEEAQNSLAARLARIDNYDLDNEYENDNMEVAKRLEFDNSFQDSKNNLQVNTKQLLSSTHTVTNKEDDILLNDKTCEQFVTNVSSPENQKILNMSLEESAENTTKRRTLRNRTIVTENSTNRMSTRNRKTDIKDLIDEKDEFNQKENKNPLKSRKQSRKKSINVEEEEVNVKKEICVTPVNVKKELRRSSRKSVKFNVEDCEACVEGKFNLPLTPYFRCSKGRLSFLQENNTPINPPSPNKDLISWDSPKIPARVIRRSTRNFTKHVF
ncbi:PREDICTED: disks large-associated protein 5-like isoform X1 [Polistes canadensis]|uniref:disks large-associated protein 5-like isoform X1 n=1 Tax=Polistes canadensis TaxID=91411 RepID=UPI000718EF1A|nr:PREDICTED: disks large-associated protein 5-like isoform X1 [Polistes canadensis]